MSPKLWPNWLQLLVGALAVALIVWLFTGPIWKVFDWFNDREAVSDHETKVKAKVIETELDAERNANRNDQGRRIIRERQTDELEQAREDAIDEEDTSVLAGPAVRAVMRELRRQASEDSDPAAGEV